MVDALSTSEGSLEAALQKQMAALNERNAQLEALLAQARGDFKKLTEEAAEMSCKAEAHLATIAQLHAAERRAEKAEELHDLLLLRRAMLQMAQATAQHRRTRRVKAAASKLGHRTCLRFMFHILRDGVRLSKTARRLRERVVGRRIAEVAALMFSMAEEASEAMERLSTRTEGGGVGADLEAALREKEAMHTATLAAMRAQVVRCGAYDAVLQAAGADEELHNSCCIHMLGACFARLVLNAAQQRLAKAEADAHAARAAVSAAATSSRALATEAQHAKMACEHARYRKAASAFAAWGAAARAKRTRAARMREGVLFQAYLLRFTADGTRLFMERQSRLAMGAGTSSGASALLWMVAARHSWLYAARQAFGALHAHWSGVKAAQLGFRSGERELLFRSMYCWSAIAQKSRVVKMKSEEGHRMRARRLLALARSTLLQWREKLASAGKLHVRLGGIRLRRETANVRKMWYTWCLSRGKAMRQATRGAEDEMEALREDLAKEGERADAADAARLQLADKLKLLSADKAKAEVELVDHKRKVENLSIALDEASVLEKDLRLQLERERLQQEELLDQQQTLRGEVSQKHTAAVTASASLAIEKETMAQEIDALRSEALELRARLGEALEGLKRRDEQVEICQATSRETMNRLDATAAQAREDAERAAAMQASLERRISDKDTELGLLKEQIRASTQVSLEASAAHSLTAPASSAAHLETIDISETGPQMAAQLGLQQPAHAGRPGSESLLDTAELLQKQHDFAKRKREIDSQFHSRMAGLGASVAGSGHSSLLSGFAGGSVELIADDENVVPNLLHSSAHGPGAKFGASVGGSMVGGQSRSFVQESVVPSPGVVTEHQQEMRSLHHEIEALQSRILSRLNSHPADLSGKKDRVPLH